MEEIVGVYSENLISIVFKKGNVQKKTLYAWLSNTEF